MADEVAELKLFVAIAAAGGMTAAAEKHNSSAANMSRGLAALESRLGVRLAVRTTRRFELTEEGQRLYERSVRLLADLDDTLNEAMSRGSVPSGMLRVGAPLEIGRREIAPMIADFTALYPAVEVQMVLSDIGQDVIDDGLDVVLRVGLPTDTSVIARKLLSSRRIICASPEYLNRRGRPLTPEDLLTHDCIRLVRGRKVFDNWVFQQDGVRKEHHVQGTLSTTSGEVVHDWAVAGRGIALKAHWDVGRDVREGRLVNLLAEYECDDIELYAVYANRQHLSPRIRVFIDYIRERLSVLEER